MNPSNPRCLFPNRPEPPDGTLCEWCREAIRAPDPYFVNPDGSMPMHHECFLRNQFGGVNCQLGQCPCYGGIEPPDPEKFTMRQASKASVAVFNLLNEKEQKGKQPS